MNPLPNKPPAHNITKIDESGLHNNNQTSYKNVTDLVNTGTTYHYSDYFTTTPLIESIQSRYPKLDLLLLQQSTDASAKLLPPELKNIEDDTRTTLAAIARRNLWNIRHDTGVLPSRLDSTEYQHHPKIDQQVTRVSKKYRELPHQINWMYLFKFSILFFNNNTIVYLYHQLY